MKLRFGLFYASGWLVFYALYALMLLGNPGMSLFAAQRGAFFTVVPAAFTGLLVWRLARGLQWTGQHRVRFFGIHVLAAVAYAASWAGFTIAQIAIFTPRSVLVMFLQRAAGWQVLMGIMIYGVIAGVAYLVQMTTRLAEQRALASRAELQALRAQLNPHFLFNTLHSVTALVREDPAAAEDALIRFGSLLRYVLDASRRRDDDTTVEDELTFARGYLGIERLRFGSRLEVIEEIDPDALDCMIPILTLQPLVENAVRHGIAPRADGGQIRISAHLLGNELVIGVSDDGNGSTDEAVSAAKGVGLSLVKRRIETRFAGKGSMVVETSAGKGFAVTLTVPAQAMTAQQIEATEPWHASLRATQGAGATA